jgi:glutathione reductase (NADPH)
MAKYDYDLITIGAGSGGVRASRMAARFGARAAIAESVRVGGTCVLRGCIPKKLLVYASHFSEDFEDAHAYGWDAHMPGFDWSRLIANKDREIDRLNGVYIRLLHDSGVAIHEGRARLLDAHTVRIGERAFSAETILIATGSRPVRLDIPGAEHAITSDEAFHLERLPRRAIIVGGGYIAVEFAGIFRGLGSEVVILIRAEELLNGFDDDIRIALAQEMRKKGVEIHTRTRPASIRRDAAGVTVTTDRGAEISADLVMFATGREPDTDGLGLEDAGVAVTETGAVKVDEFSATSVPNIYAVGDVTDRLMLTPVAIAEAMAFAETVFNANPTRPHYRNVPSAVFSQPPIGTVGLTEDEARRAITTVDVYLSRFRPLKHTLTGRDERTLMKLVVDASSDLVLGCHMLGPDAPEIVQGLAVALKCGARKADFDATVGIHPTAAEEFVTMREKARTAAAAAE